MSEDVYVRFREVVREEIAADELQPSFQTVLLDILLEDRRHLGEVEANACALRLSEGYLHSKGTLRGSDIGEASILAPSALPCDCHIGAVPAPRRRSHE